MKLFISRHIKSVNLKNRTVEAIISDESVDRDGEIIKQDGLKVDNFMKNPVVLFNHGGSPFSSRDSLPIGRVEKIQKFKNETHAIIKFASKQVSQRADQVFQLFKGGFMNTFSIGFKSLSDPVKTEKGLELPETELLELSAVTIPANPNAVAKNYSGSVENFKKLCAIIQKETKNLLEAEQEVSDMETKQINEKLDNIIQKLDKILTKDNEESQEEETQEETTEEATDDDATETDETTEEDTEDDEEEKAMLMEIYKKAYKDALDKNLKK